MSTDQLGVEVSLGDSGSVISVSGEIDYGNVSRLRTALITVTNEGSEEVTVDLASVSFIDSTALSVLVQGKQRLEEMGRTLRIENPTSRVHRTLELAGVLDYLLA